MPPLGRPPQKTMITLPPRNARLAGDTDVLVVGGGPAGLGAAIGAAEAGAQVVLAERYGFLGGNATAALVMPMMSFSTEHHRREQTGVNTLLPTDHGPGEPVVAGVLKSFLTRLISEGGAISPSLNTGFTVPFDPEQFKHVALEMLDDAGVQFLFHALASDVIGGSKVKGVVFETKSGPVVIRAKSVIDCTGDGDIAAYAGAPFELGRADDGLVQPMSLLFRMADFDHASFSDYVNRHPSQWRGVHGLWDLIRTAAAQGELNLPREDILFFATPHPREISVNSTRVTRPTRVLGIDVWDLTYAEWESRRQMRQIVSFLRKRVPGFAQAYLMQSGVTVGVRETRRVIGDYKLTEEDVLGARKFEDVIARCTYPIDEHNPKGTGTVLKRLPAGEAYDIPLRCLIPKKTDHLLVAGRCISGTHEAHSSYRVMPVSMAVGQAAGVCGALAALSNTSPRSVPFRDVKTELIRQGADLRQHTA